ncbi:unnamed protein product [Spirodela intermedia]|uniref:C3H1-type domain-containing protein n=1 Tax=Spirodela intermedia TaxID=51605 RepID=A0A7I8JJR5_SPIIN|nr:unnamed protein product [Spirodela intermedia]CAA6670379.1 unnamed protein product [Spirodela intermedia]
MRPPYCLEHKCQRTRSDGRLCFNEGHGKPQLCLRSVSAHCQYGDRCKFLHTTQQQPKASTVGLVQQSQQQRPNPFGFGVQSVSHSVGSHSPSQPQPFINKWTRSSSAAASTKPSKQADAQTQGAHQMPSDIVGDVSYEELRAAAYEDARKGLSLQTIVERERNLLNIKLLEFDNLRQKPHVILQSPISARPSFPRSSATMQHQLLSKVTQPLLSLVLASSFQVQNQTSSVFGMKFGPSDLSLGTSLPTQASQFSLPVQPMQNSNNSTFRLPGRPDDQTITGNVVSQPLASGPPVESKQEINAEDCAIWLKKEWEIGEKRGC